MSVRRRPRVLYKYIKASAIESIFGDRQLLWTRADYLDDPSESAPGRLTHLDWEKVQSLAEPRLRELAAPSCSTAFVEQNDLTRDIKRLRCVSNADKWEQKFQELNTEVNKMYSGWSKEFQSNIQTLVDQYAKRYVCSMSEQPDSQPLWSRYGDSHVGLAIGFASRLHLPQGSVGASPMRYCNDIRGHREEEWLEYCLSTSKFDDVEFLHRIMFGKSTEWLWEHEWRFVMRSYPDAPPRMFTPLEYTNVREVIFGAKMSQAVIDRVRELAFEFNPTIALSRIIASSVDGRLNAEPIE